MNQRRAKDDVKEAKAQARSAARAAEEMAKQPPGPVLIHFPHHAQAALFRQARDEMQQQLEQAQRLMKLAQLEAAEAKRSVQAAQLETHALREQALLTGGSGVEAAAAAAERTLGAEESGLSNGGHSATGRTPRALRPSGDQPSPYSARGPALQKEASGRKPPALKLPLVKQAKGRVAGLSAPNRPTSSRTLSLCCALPVPSHTYPHLPTHPYPPQGPEERRHAGEGAQRQEPLRGGAPAEAAGRGVAAEEQAGGEGAQGV